MTHDNTHTAWYINTTNCELEHVHSVRVERWRRLVAVADYQQRLLVTGPTNLLQFTFPSASLERSQWWSACFSPSGSRGDHGCTTTKTETLASVLRVSFLTRKIYCSLLIAWSRHLFVLAFRTGKMLQPSFPSTKLAGVTKIPCWRRLRLPLQHVMLVW